MASPEMVSKIDNARSVAASGTCANLKEVAETVGVSVSSLRRHGVKISRRSPRNTDRPGGGLDPASQPPHPKRVGGPAHYALLHARRPSPGRAAEVIAETLAGMNTRADDIAAGFFPAYPPECDDPAGRDAHDTKWATFAMERTGRFFDARDIKRLVKKRRVRQFGREAAVAPSQASLDQAMRNQRAREIRTAESRGPRLVDRIPRRPRPAQTNSRDPARYRL